MGEGVVGWLVFLAGRVVVDGLESLDEDGEEDFNLIAKVA